MKILWISLGGAIGTAARYLLSTGLLHALGSAFPYGTLVVNVVGSFLLGLVMHIGLNSEALNPTIRLALSTGVLGGFTTYSTFNYETLQYARESAWFLAAANVLATMAGCLAAGLLGIAVGKLLVGGS
ncbi:MAG TPA: fluoride efflux transporter CrcB [Thermoanaerobaculia bacterium]